MAIFACLVAAAALYAGRGVLDVAWVEDRPVRVALLPPWESLAGFAVLAGLVLVFVDRWRRAAAAGAPPAAVLLRPLFGLAVLLLPLLPVVPDRWPVLQALAGPMAVLVWLATGGLLLWTWSQHGLLTFSWVVAAGRGRQMLLVALVTALAGSLTASRFMNTVLAPSGDEPHYLVIAQSLWRDGDLKIENNHQRGDYREFFTRDLEPHYVTRGRDGAIYSIHPIGLPVLIAPVYALGGYPLVVLAIVAMASAAAALMWRFVAVTLGSHGGATFAWGVTALSAPFLLNSFTVYPEVAAALAVVVALTTNRPLAAGLACAALPWLSTKYAPMSAVLLALGSLRGGSSSPWRLAPARELFWRIGPYVVSLAAWFGFFYAVWGSPWPQAPYGALVQTTPRNLVFGAPGLLFDQEYGLLPYAPAYILAATGTWRLWGQGGERRMLAIRVALVFAALLGTVGAFRIWWGGSASPGRPLASGLLILGVPIAAAWLAAPAGSARRAAHLLLLSIGAGVTTTLVLAQQGLLTSNGRDGTSSLLEWWSPLWELWTLAPSFIHHEAPTAALHSVAWLAVAALTALGLGRLRGLSPAGAALAAWTGLCAALVLAAAVVPLLPDDPPLPRVNLQARSRLAALDAYDTRALPAAVVYDPLRKTDAASVLPALRLEVVPGIRRDPQPLRVIHNGRFSLPAGTYRVDVAFDAPASAGTVGFQVGRIGAPLVTRQVNGLTALTETVELPADAGFFGLRGPLDLERHTRAIVITPVRVVNRGDRPRTPPVLAAGRYGTATILLHDELGFAEPEGVWLLGQRRVRLSLAPEGTAPIVLRVRSGVADNRVRLSTGSWVHTVVLAADTPVDVTLPPPRRGLVTLTVETSNGFVPIERDSRARDRRFLGVWVEVPAAAE